MFSGSADKKEEPFHRSKLAGGPHGLGILLRKVLVAVDSAGDPDDRTLRKVESEVLVKERMRVKARKELCEPFNLAFANCAKEHGLFMPFSCQEQGQNLKNCIRKYFEDPEFEKKMQEEYLEERAEYRRTGISKKKRERMEALSQLNAQANQQQSK